MICYKHTIVLLPVFDGEAEKGVYLNRQGGLSQCLNHGFMDFADWLSARSVVLIRVIRFINDLNNLDITGGLFSFDQHPLQKRNAILPLIMESFGFWRKLIVPREKFHQV